MNDDDPLHKNLEEILERRYIRIYIWEISNYFLFGTNDMDDEILRKSNQNDFLK